MGVRRTNMSCTMFCNCCSLCSQDSARLRRHDALPLESYSRTPPPAPAPAPLANYVIRNPYCGHSYDKDAFARLMSEQGDKAV